MFERISALGSRRPVGLSGGDRTARFGDHHCVGRGVVGAPGDRSCRPAVHLRHRGRTCVAAHEQRRVRSAPGADPAWSVTRPAFSREEVMMKRLYRVLAYLIAAGVVLQAAAIAYAVFGMFEWVSAGGTIDRALIESDDPQLGGITGFNLHQTVGVTILPLLALLFLISSFFARIPGGIRWALIVF